MLTEPLPERDKIKAEMRINQDQEPLKLKIREVLRYFIDQVAISLTPKIKGISGQEIETIKAILNRIFKNLENDGILQNPANINVDYITSDHPSNLQVEISPEVLIQCVNLALQAKKLLQNIGIDCPELEKFSNFCKSGLPPEKR